jgi:ubiquinone/menaquinone biosynthesis C-methylase UbiE
MDYDQTEIAANYDLGRDHGPKVLELWMDVVESHAGDRPIKTVLDLGCGTGRFSEALAIRFDAEVIGIDPSKKMLEQARSKPTDSRVQYQQGSAESIPVEDDTIDLLFMSMVFHHFKDPPAAARECRRVLRRNAIAFLRAGTRERISSYPYVEFFPGSRPILEKVLPTTTDVSEAFKTAGFCTKAIEVVTQELASSYAAYAEKLSAGADSVLASLDQREFGEGMEALRAFAASAGKRAVFEPIDVFIFE